MTSDVRRGLLPGKFMPLHEGHIFVCRTALQLCDELTILVLSKNDDPVSGLSRMGRMENLFPAARVVHYEAEALETPADRPDTDAIGRDVIKRLHPEQITHVFGSNARVHTLAEEVGGQSVILDPDHEAVPISRTTAHDIPFNDKDHLPGIAPSCVVRRVCVTGPESTGKTTLARDLAARFDTLYMPEYGRIYDEQYRPEVWTPAHLVTIAETHRAMRRALEPLVTRVLMEDTDALLTTVWSEALAGSVDPWFDQDFELADLYLLTDIDVPWVGDGLRLFGRQEERRAFFDKAKAVLDASGANYIVLSGDWETRRHTAIAAVNSLLKEAM